MNKQQRKEQTINMQQALLLALGCFLSGLLIMYCHFKFGLPW